MRKPRWDAWENWELELFAKGLSNKEIAHETSRTYTAVANKKRRIGYTEKKNYKYWTTKEEALVESGASYAELMAATGRSRMSIARKKAQLSERRRHDSC